MIRLLSATAERRGAAGNLNVNHQFTSGQMHKNQTLLPRVLFHQKEQIEIPVAPLHCVLFNEDILHFQHPSTILHNVKRLK